MQSTVQSTVQRGGCGLRRRVFQVAPAARSHRPLRCIGTPSHRPPCLRSRFGSGETRRPLPACPAGLTMAGRVQAPCERIARLRISRATVYVAIMDHHQWQWPQSPVVERAHRAIADQPSFRQCSRWVVRGVPLGVPPIQPEVAGLGVVAALILVREENVAVRLGLPKQDSFCAATKEERQTAAGTAAGTAACTGRRVGCT